MALVSDKSSLKRGNKLQNSFWEIIGLEENILKLQDKNDKNFKIPMISKNSSYYDVEIELYKTDSDETLFIALIIKKSTSSIKYLEAIQEINQKTLLLQNNDSNEIKKNYYNLINDQLVTFHVDTNGLITEVNSVCSYFLSKDSKDLIGLHFSKFFHTRSSTLINSSDKILNATNSLGEDIFFHIDVIPVKKENVVYENIIICQDITYLKKIEKELEYAASHDTLTGLANRSRLLKKIDEAILESQENKTSFGVCFMDLDKFKSINDNYGHHAGDMLLKHAASLLENFIRSFDTAARIGGDEFIILFRDIKNENYLQTTIERINQLVDENPLLYSEEDTIPFKFSLGASSYPQDAKTAKELLDVADKNMYQSKRQK